MPKDVNSARGFKIRQFTNVDSLVTVASTAEDPIRVIKSVERTDYVTDLLESEDYVSESVISTDDQILVSEGLFVSNKLIVKSAGVFRSITAQQANIFSDKKLKRKVRLTDDSKAIDRIMKLSPCTFYQNGFEKRKRGSLPLTHPKR